MKAVRQRGFTLIELMITVAIVGILASIALPSYKAYVKRGHRAAAQAEMMDLANREQQFLLSNRSYVGKAALTASGYAPPADVTSRYTWAVVPNNAASPPTFTVVFTPIGAQAGDGILLLNSVGLKTRAGDPAKW
jgi:type IV pilus assembly protein PilE